ncbi:MAG: hypothetical protein QF880_05575 [Candidatus Poseidonia sp.]|nr:hypothetical protein [Poseidonia sp.]
MIPSEGELMKLKKDELVEMAKGLDLAVSGTKQELAQRVIQHNIAIYDKETDRLEDVLYHTPEEGEGMMVKEQPSESTDSDEEVSAEDGEKPSVLENLKNFLGKEKEASVSSENHVVFDELPSRTFVAGGTNAKVFLATVATTFILMFGYGFGDYYGDYFSFEGSDKKTVDCIHITYYTLGNGNDSEYDPTAEANIECAEFLDVSPNYWQEEMDAWIASLVGNAASSGNHTGFVWTQAGIDTMASLGETTFNVNMSVYGDPVAGDEFTEQHLNVWNGFAAGFPGGGNDTIESLLPGGNSPFAIYMPAGIVAHKPTGYLWTQSGIDTMAYLGTTTFNANMSVYGDPVAGDVFTQEHLAVWNGFGAMFPGGGNDSFADLLPGGGSPFAIYMPYGIVEDAPTGYLWSHPGVPTMAYLGSSTFGANMSVYGDPAPGDVFTAEHLAVWNGFTATMGGGNDTYASLLPGGDSPFAIYMPSGIVITEAEWTNQTPIIQNLTINSSQSGDGSGNTTYEVAYLFIDAQSDNDTSSFAWFVNGTYVGNSSTYTAELSNGSVISVRLTPFDGLYTGEVVEAELQILTEDDA